mmetsp:Transcript_34446/g.120242  ORF Transcript_34446/g.120242 Transcript_34446/m.120242 type:complete len:292 (+) Transcript_34446:42-917(+)
MQTVGKGSRRDARVTRIECRGTPLRRPACVHRRSLGGHPVPSAMRPFRVRVRRPPTSRRPHVSTSRHMLAQHTETRGYVSASIRSRMSPGTDARSSIRSRMPPNASTPTSSTLRRTSWRHVLPCRPCKNARPQPSSKRLFSRRNDTSVLFRSSAAASAHPPPGPSAFSLRFKDRIASFFASMSANARPATGPLSPRWLFERSKWTSVTLTSNACAMRTPPSHDAKFDRRLMDRSCRSLSSLIAIASAAALSKPLCSRLMLTIAGFSLSASAKPMPHSTLRPLEARSSRRRV